MIGSIIVGQQADLVLLDLRRLNVTPDNEPADAIILSADTGNVVGVYVAGSAVKTAGRFVNKAAATRALRLGKCSRDHRYRAKARRTRRTSATDHA
jgi:cytosine/adenosine deaminase-related metal-dependent hydrolase